MSVAPPPPATIGGEGYRPHLDGLRALAVYLVVLFHGGSAFFDGGFVGVDVFFVLSGYLVTQLLWRDLDAGGAIRLGRFYARRVRRILPAAIVALTATALVYAAIAPPPDVAAARGAFAAAFLFVANWFFIDRSTAYFSGNIAQNPVLHFWSLAVEEQFYLVWPLMLGGGFAASRRLGARPLPVLRLGLAIGAAASLLWALALRAEYPEHAYYGTDARAYQLLFGALLALTPAPIAALRRRPRLARLLACASLVGLVVLATALVALDPIVRGAAVAVATCVALAAIEGADGGVARRLLSLAPLVYLGRISYGTYIWHWPVVLVLTFSGSLGSAAMVVLTAAISSALASLSFQLVENPIRISPRLDAWRAGVIATGIAASAAAALLLTPAILDPAAVAGRAANAERVRGTAIPSGLNFTEAGFQSLVPPPDCVDKPAEACTLVRGDGPHILLIGDSHARMMIATFAAMAQRENLTLSVIAAGGCPWQRHLYTSPRSEEPCRARREDAYTRVIPALRPDVIIAAGYGQDDPRGPVVALSGEDGRRFRRGRPEFEQLWRTTTEASIVELSAMAARGVVIIEPIPLARPREDPTACLSRKRFLEDCRYVVPLEPLGMEQLYRRIDERDPRVWSIDIDRLVCPWLPVCDPVVGGRIVKVDAHHLTLEYATALAVEMADRLKANGLIPAHAAAPFEHAANR